MYYIVYDNFLPAREFGDIKSYLGPDGNFPWTLSGRINSEQTENQVHYFGTNIFHSHNSPREQWNPGVEIDKFFYITSKLYIEAFQRIKANLYFPSTTDKVTPHAPHVDTDFKHNGALFFLTTCDAPTQCMMEQKLKVLKTDYYSLMQLHLMQVLLRQIHLTESLLISIILEQEYSRVMQER